MPTDETVRRVITSIALLIFVAYNLLIVRHPGIRQILERLFDFVVLQFDTSSKRKKGRNFQFLKSSGLTELFTLLAYMVYIIVEITSENKKGAESLILRNQQSGA